MIKPAAVHDEGLCPRLIRCAEASTLYYSARRCVHRLSDNPLTDAGCVCLLDGLLASHRRDVERRHLAAIADTADSVVATVMADVIGDGAADDERDADAVAVVGGEGNSTATGGAEQRAGGLRLEELGLADVGMATGGVAALARLLRAGMLVHPPRARVTP